jgi:hypothetical protein
MILLPLVLLPFQDRSDIVSFIKKGALTSKGVLRSYGVRLFVLLTSRPLSDERKD